MTIDPDILLTQIISEMPCSAQHCHGRVRYIVELKWAGEPVFRLYCMTCTNDLATKAAKVLADNNDGPLHEYMEFQHV